MTERSHGRRGDVTQANVQTYSQSDPTWIARGERRLFDRYLKPGMTVMDLGCGTGRVTRELLRRGLRVWACDLSMQALDSVRSLSSDKLVVDLADARELSYQDRSFDAVVFAFNGLDMIHPEQDRFRAVAEINRVLRPGGVFIFSSHNPLGTMLSPLALRSRSLLRWQLRYLRDGEFRSRYFRDPSGLLLYQAQPRHVISDVQRNAPLMFERAINKSGTATALPILTQFSVWPYYVFRKAEPNARHA